LQTFGTAIARRDLDSSSVVPRLEEVGVDGTALVFALLLALTVGVACGLIPALWQSRVRASLGPAHGTGTLGFRLSRARAVLLVGQIGLAIVLLLSSGLLIRSFIKLAGVNPGYATSSVLTFQVALPPGTPALSFSADVLARVQALPGVRAAGWADRLPLTSEGVGRTVLGLQPQAVTSVVPPPPPPPGAAGKPDFPTLHIVSPDFLGALGATVVEGRSLADLDAGTRTESMLINRALAQSRYLGDQPIGTTVYLNGNNPWTVVGIVDDLHESGIGNPPGPQIFISVERAGLRQDRFRDATPYFAIRTDRSPAAMVPAIRELVRDLDPRSVPDRIATMEEIVSNSILRPRFYAGIFGLFAVLAGALAAIGLHGGIAFAVSRRTREIGIRVALGATKPQILRTVAGEMLACAAGGIVLGIAGGMALTRYLDQMLFDLTPLDPAVFVAVPVSFAMVVGVAAFLSTRPALSQSALHALRHE
jgi:putative ABC transport system permease protein